MKIRDSLAFVTRANRGLGLAFAQELHATGAKVYAAARNPERIPLDGVHRVRLDVVRFPFTRRRRSRSLGNGDRLLRAAPAQSCICSGPSEEPWWRMWRIIVNLLSIMSWVSVPTAGTYSASKAATCGFDELATDRLA